KLIIDLDSAHGRVKGEKAEQEWNSEYRQRVYAPDKEIRFIIRAEVEPLRKYHPDKEKSETDQEQNRQSPHPSRSGRRRRLIADLGGRGLGDVVPYLAVSSGGYHIIAVIIGKAEPRQF